MLLCALFKFPILFFFILFLSVLSILSEEELDTSAAAANLVDVKPQPPPLTQNELISSDVTLKNKVPKGLLTFATKFIKNGVKVKRRRELVVGPATAQHLNKSLTVFLTTFNAGGYTPPTSCLQNPGDPPSADSLCHWLDFKGQQPDLVVIGLQEMSSLTIQNYFASTIKRTNKKQDVWLSAIENVLNRSDRKYKKLKHVRLLGLFAVVYYHSSVSITEVHKATVSTGFMGRIGNKGSVGISLQIGDDLSICFLNSHLTAGEGKEGLDARNMDVARIASKMRFKGKTLNEHDVVFWMGDLNYRLSELSMSREEVIEKCQNGKFKGLLKYDELLKGRLAGGVWADYQEAEINFRPTYKFEAGSDQWDESEKMRLPAWCDRILFKASNKWKVEIIESTYDSVDTLITSDHKPNGQ